MEKNTKIGKTCLTCGKNINFLRTDAKFCSDKCRQKHHSKQKEEILGQETQKYELLEVGNAVFEDLKNKIEVLEAFANIAYAYKIREHDHTEATNKAIKALEDLSNTFRETEHLLVELLVDLTISEDEISKTCNILGINLDSDKEPPEDNFIV
ncbi:MAG: DUF2116 family Zn-ribbon domain-containing protein [Thermonemataceae bacterium]|nr:DUF2116 family Zn-ribbon domain-containing protein [Thermonemataceae bacterium]